MITKSIKEKPLEQMVISAQNGDTSVHNYLLKTYQPFIAKCVSEVCKRYINPKHDDEFSIGLSAFNEAIFSYSREKGSSFLPFAKLVIKRKVIDYIRSNQKVIKAVSLDENYDDVQMENPTEIRVAKEKYQENQNTVLLREEIAEFKEKLSEYKLSLTELTEVSPKHKDARESAIQTARVLYEDEELRQYVLEKKKLPIKNLTKKVEVSKKTLERNRKFILAIFIVLSEEFIYLKDYLKGVGQ
ncbi:RNA polymerase sigma factor SigI [Oceanobacillus salinisoli]|uniref:RNA polymerase sigma factor SigI n=1 Tax=Oceanobacillus salinisoli TaxID=2678611 RepID=UPI0012E206DA|nr:RNA polymerase sigma factor SigI [Oceanobacillus salinisoli]